jgi:hypothetical protein
VRVGQDLVAQRRIADERAPGLRPAEEEALVAGDAVEHGRFAAAQREIVGVVGDLQAAIVADVLAQRQAAVHIDAFQRREGVVLLDQTVGHFGEARHVLLVPPVAQHALRIRLGALVVEAVAHFVADHAADGAVIWP